jgi:hypothetical protein
MSKLIAALAETKAGYDAGKSMHDEGMIDHAETITTSCDEIITAVAKARVLDRMLAMVQGDRNTIHFDEAFANSLTAMIDREVERIEAAAPTDSKPSAQMAGMRM